MMEQISVATVTVSEGKHRYLQCLLMSGNLKFDITPVVLAFTARKILLSYKNILGLARTLGLFFDLCDILANA